MNYPDDFEDLIQSLHYASSPVHSTEDLISQWNDTLQFLQAVDTHYPNAQVYVLIRDVQDHLETLRVGLQVMRIAHGERRPSQEKQDFQPHPSCPIPFDRRPSQEKPRPDHQVVTESPPDPLARAREAVLHTLNILREAAADGLLKPCPDCSGVGSYQDGPDLPCYTCHQTGLVPHSMDCGDDPDGN